MNYASGASLTSPVFVPNRGDTTTGIASGVQGNINTIISGAESSRWTGTGYAIGTTSAIARLTVAATSSSSTIPLLALQSPDKTSGLATSSIFVVLPSGKVGIATTTPTYLLSVGSVSVADGIQVGIRDADGVCTLDPDSGGSWSCTSDARLKHDIKDTTQSGLGYVSDFRIRDFILNANGQPYTGVIAQELLAKHPELVSKGDDGFYTVMQPNNWLIVKAVQETWAKMEQVIIHLAGLDKRVYDLEVKTNEQQKTIEALEARLDKLEHSNF